METDVFAELNSAVADIIDDLEKSTPDERAKSSPPLQDRPQPRPFDKPVWTVGTCRKLLAKYPDDILLWHNAVNHLKEQQLLGASDEYRIACLEALEREWELARNTPPTQETTSNE